MKTSSIAVETSWSASLKVTPLWDKQVKNSSIVSYTVMNNVQIINDIISFYLVHSVKHWIILNLFLKVINNSSS